MNIADDGPSFGWAVPMTDVMLRFHSESTAGVLSSLTPAYAVTESIFFDPAPALKCGGLADACDNGVDGSGGLGLIGIDPFAPNDLSFHFFTVGPFNE